MEDKLHPKIEIACEALDDLAKGVLAFAGDGRRLNEIHGWMAPSLTIREVASMASQLAADIRSASPDDCLEDILEFIDTIPQRVTVLKNSVLPQFPSGNIGQALPAYISTLQFIRATVLPTVGWIDIPTNSALPAKLARRATAAQRQLDELVGQIPALGTKISEIEAAHAVSENLAFDLQALAEARAKVEKAVAETAVQNEKAKGNSLSSQQRLDDMKLHAETAAKLIAQCEDAYQITTTKGLAGAFDQRAQSLAWSMRGWVIGLAGALATGAYIGSARLATLTAELGSKEPRWSLVATHVVISVLGIGAPLWFSWLATKQIGQRFRLSEDYAFKASVAKAYEGYRKEAAKIDPEFQSKLFGSALTRLDEAPLRLVETEQHSTPWQEFANSDAIKNALKLAPELQAKVIEAVRDALKNASNAAGQATKVVADASKSSTVDER
jgi:hypothetical protein